MSQLFVKFPFSLNTRPSIFCLSTFKFIKPFCHVSSTNTHISTSQTSQLPTSTFHQPHKSKLQSYIRPIFNIHLPISKPHSSHTISPTHSKLLLSDAGLSDTRLPSKQHILSTTLHFTQPPSLQWTSLWLLVLLLMLFCSWWRCWIFFFS